jgi:hypothetical protein
MEEREAEVRAVKHRTLILVGNVVALWHAEVKVIHTHTHTHTHTNTHTQRVKVIHTHTAPPR